MWKALTVWGALALACAHGGGPATGATDEESAPEPRWEIDCGRAVKPCRTDLDGGAPILLVCPAGEVCHGRGPSDLFER